MSDHIPTLADVCSAIAEGRLAVASDGFVYQVNAFELRRHFNRIHSLPAITFLDRVLTSSSYESHDTTPCDIYSCGR